MVAIDEVVGAFVPGPRSEHAPLGSGWLSGLIFAVKHLFDISGIMTACGNPDWARTRPPTAGTGPAALQSLQAGAHMGGKTKTQELARGLTNENTWHGIPINPRAPDCFPGSSSSSSAATVAGGLVDFAVGSDTGDSACIPASYCRMFDIRSTHGAASLVGVCPLAPGCDTWGWFTGSASPPTGIGDVLLAASRYGADGPMLRVEEAG